MTRLIQVVVKALVLVMLLALSITGTMAQGTAEIRFVHLIPDAVPVDVYVNGTLAVKNLDYAQASNYITVPAGDHNIIATAAGLSAGLWEQNVSISESSQTTFIASDGILPQFTAFSDNLNTVAFGISRLAIIHALSGGETVSVQLAESVVLGDTEQPAGSTIVPEIAYGAKSGEFDLPAQTYVVDVTPLGGSDALVSNVALSLSSNSSYMAVIYGTASNPGVLLLSARTVPGEDTGLLRFVHGIVDGPTVDVLVNGSLIVAGLTPDNPTEHIALLSGDHEVVYVIAGTEDALASTSVKVDDSGAQTLAALVVGDEVVVSTFTDDISNVDTTQAGVSVLNTIDGATVTVELLDGTVLGEAGSGEQSDATVFAPVSAETSFTLNIDGNEGTLAGDDYVFYGGVYYNIIVLDGSMFGAPSLVIAPSTVSQTLASAPGAGDVTLVTGDTAPPADTSTQTEVQATQAPAVSQPVDTPADVIVGEIALDPSANLNLRQYPNAEALVLGQAPSGAQLIIVGREGIPVALVEGNPPPPEAETYVDPVEELGEGQDLDSTQTWLRVLYNTPDGGEIEAWTLSQYLIITDDEGLFALRDLETTAGNIQGETRNTDVTPPPPPEDIVTVQVININPGAGLNIRRNPDATSEVLGQLSVGTVVEFGGLLASNTGLLTDSEWAFVAYSPVEGGVITGWTSTNFLTYLWNGDDTDLEELIDRGFIEEVTEDLIGEVSAGTAPVTAATPDPEIDAYVAEIALDPGANLNMRRTPDVQGEVLLQIPSAAFVIVTARTSDGEWLETNFEGEVGWIASQFVIITFNGDFVDDVFEIPGKSVV